MKTPTEKLKEGLIESNNINEKTLDAFQKHLNQIYHKLENVDEKTDVYSKKIDRVFSILMPDPVSDRKGLAQMVNENSSNISRIIRSQELEIAKHSEQNINSRVKYLENKCREIDADQQILMTKIKQWAFFITTTGGAAWTAFNYLVIKK